MIKILNISFALVLFLSSLLPAIAAQKTIDLPAGKHTYGPFSLNNNVKSVSLTIDRTFWTQPSVGATISATFTGNFTGSTWGCSASGQGSPTATAKPAVMRCKVPAGTSRSVTIVVEVTGGTLQVGADPSFSTRE